jgi:hypothetical protein
MSKTPAELAREQRLAAKLRENLKRRKLQARARTAGTSPPGDDAAAPADSAAGSRPSSDTDSNR